MELIIIAKCFYLLIPAYLANMAPVIVKNINFLNISIDCGKTMNKQPIFGKNKTYRGFFFGVIFAIIGSFVQYSLYQSGIFVDISFHNYKNWFFFGFLMGFGALLGDLVKSFFKRRLKIKPGKKFIPFDQTDFVIGALLLTAPLVKIDLMTILYCIILSFILHIIVNHLAFFFKIRKEKW